jgi:CSLREA domain-containing protein
MFNRGIPIICLRLALRFLLIFVFCLECRGQNSSIDFSVNSVMDRADANPGDEVCSTGSLLNGQEKECTLRAAVNEANAISLKTPDRKISIRIPAGNYSLAAKETCLKKDAGATSYSSEISSTLCITGNMTLTGADSATTVIDGVLVGRVFFVSSGATVSINKVTIQHGAQIGGSNDRGGGGVNNQGSLNLSSDLFTENKSDVGGGGVYNAGNLTVEGCTFQFNSGRAIAANYATTSIDLTYFNQNSGFQGAAIYTYFGTLQVSNSTFSNNTVEENGILAAFSTPTTIVNSTFSSNNVGNAGTIVTSGLGSSLMMNGDTVYGNIVGNSNDGIYSASGILSDSATIANTILANNGISGTSDCNVGVLTNLGHNLIKTSPFIRVCQGGDNSTTLTGVDPKLGPLEINGGLIQTQTPLPGSLVINAGSKATPGSNEVGACPALDERGFVRGRYGFCTIGATDGAANPLKGFEIDNVQPKTAGAGGRVTVSVQGSGFAGGSTVALKKRGGPTVLPLQTLLGVDTFSIAAVFDLTKASIGAYDVVVTKPDGSSTALAGGFAVEQAIKPDIYLYVYGNTVGRPEKPAYYFVVYGNRGNVEAYLVPLTLSLPGGYEGSIYSPVLPPPPITGQVISDWTRVPLEVDPSTATGFTNVPLIIPVIPANSQSILFFSVTPPVSVAEGATYTFDASLGDPYGTGVDGAIDPAILSQYLAGAKNYMGSYLGATPSSAVLGKMSVYASKQLAQIVSDGEQALLSSATAQPVFFSNAQLSIDVANYGAGIANNRTSSAGSKLEAVTTSFDTSSQMKAVTAALSGGSGGGKNPCSGQVMNQGGTCDTNPTPVPSKGPEPNPNGIPRDVCSNMPKHHISADGTRCVPDNPHGCPAIPNPELEKEGCGTFKILGSIDPNEKDGPLSVGNAHFSLAREPFQYQIEFENSPSASAAAQTVTVVDRLDSTRYDLETFELGPILFGSYLLTPPPGLASFTSALDLRPSANVIVIVRANLDKSTGTATWNFVSLDPGTMQTVTDPRAGFLPPDTNPPSGIGHVAFTVRLRTGLASGVEICNSAKIVFDTNAPIATAPFCNSKDTSPPTSHILTLNKTESSPTFPVSWTGIDSGAGVAIYSIYVSTDGGTFSPWLIGASKTSASYPGSVGRTYGFYSIATDLLGNTEPPKTGAETSTSVGPENTCALDVTSKLMITNSGFRRDPASKQFLQTVTIQNTSGTEELGPIALVIGSLPAGVSLASPSGVTSCARPSGAPYVVLNNGSSLNAGATTTYLLHFIDPTSVGITHSNYVYQGSKR